MKRVRALTGLESYRKTVQDLILLIDEIGELRYQYNHTYTNDNEPVY
jgi:hypothetical protein